METNQVELPTQAEVDQFVQKNLPWNFGVNLVDISFITMGLSLISRETVMPVLVSNLTGSKLAVGMIPAIFSLGFYLPQLFSANFSERMRYKKPFVMFWGGLGERVPYGLMAVAIWLFALSNPVLAAASIMLLLGVTAFSAGFATPAWYDIIGKVLPENRRGVWSGVSHGLGAFISILGAYIIGIILEAYAYPNNFAILFALAFIATAISWVGLASNREPPSLIIKEEIPLTRYLRQLPTVLRENHNYRRFLISRTMIYLGAMASSFFIVYGTERFSSDATSVAALTATMTAVMVASKAVTNVVWGLMGDRMGHKVVLTASAFGMALAALVAWMAASTLWLGLTFVLLGAYMAADEVSSLNIILEFCAPEDRPTYIGLTNTLLAPALTLSPIIGGILATQLGYTGMFVVALILGLVGAVMLATWVKEPRGLST